METSSLVSLRIGELISESKRPMLQELAELQEHGNDDLPTDHYTDSRDLFELVTGEKILPLHLGTERSSPLWAPLR